MAKNDDSTARDSSPPPEQQSETKSATEHTKPPEPKTRSEIRSGAKTVTAKTAATAETEAPNGSKPEPKRRSGGRRLEPLPQVAAVVFNRRRADADLVRRLRAAWGQVNGVRQELYLKRVVRIVATICAIRGLPDDKQKELAQETFIRVVETIRRLRDPSRLSGFIWGVALGRLSKMFRQERRSRVPVHLVLTPETIEHAGFARVRLEHLRLEAAFHLPLRLRPLFYIHLFARLTLDECAKVLEVSRATVRHQWFQVLALLAQCEACRELLADDSE